MIKFLVKGDYYLSLLTLVHSIFMRVEITCGVYVNQLVLWSTFSQARKKHCKVTYLNWKANRKEHTVETL